MKGTNVDLHLGVKIYWIDLNAEKNSTSLPDINSKVKKHLVYHLQRNPGIKTSKYNFMINKMINNRDWTDTVMPPSWKYNC